MKDRSLVFAWWVQRLMGSLSGVPCSAQESQMMAAMTEFMGEHRQLSVALKMADSSKAAPDLVLGRMLGEESLGRPYRYVLTLFSQDSGHPNAPTMLSREVMGGLLGGEACVKLDYQAGIKDQQRYFHGMITGFSYMGLVAGTGISMYEAVVQPNLHLLEISQEYRIFRHVSAVEIIRSLLLHADLEEGTDFIFDLVESDDGVRTQTIQYEESDLNFMHRLLEQVGVSYRFVHREDGHQMIFTNFNSVIPDIHDPENQSNQQKPAVNFLYPHQQEGQQSGIHHYQFSFETCTQTIQGSFIHHEHAHKTNHISSQLFDDPFDYARNPKHFRKRHYPFGDYIHYVGETEDKVWTGDPSKSKAGMTTVMAARERSYSDHYIAESNHRYLQCGYSFDFSNHPAEHENEKKLIIGASYQLYAEEFPYLHEMTQDPTPVFQARVKVQPESHSYVIPGDTPKPSINGVHSATVVYEAPDGSVDLTGQHQRVDANASLGVKVKIHWASSESALNGNNPHQVTDYIRVSQFWAGKERGAVFTPRVGDEVLVAFMHGNPDDPVIVGSVYNSTNTPFIDANKHPMLSGIRTRVENPDGYDVLPKDYKSHLYADLVFNDDASSEHKGLALRVSRGSTDDDPYLITDEEENINLADDAAGFMVKTPGKSQKDMLLAINAGEDTETIYRGNTDVIQRHISTTVGPMTSTNWNNFGISHFSVSITSKALYNVKQMTPGAVITTGIKGNSIRSYIGSNDMATGLRSPGALVELGTSVAEWVLVGTSQLKNKIEVAQMAAELSTKLPSIIMNIKGIVDQARTANVAMGGYTAIEMVPGVLKQVCKDNEGDESQLLMSQRLMVATVGHQQDEGSLRITPCFIRTQAADAQNQATVVVSVRGIEHDYATNADTSSFHMIAGQMIMTQTGSMVVSQQFSNRGTLITSVAPVVVPPVAAVGPAVMAAAGARASARAASGASDAADALSDMSLLAAAIPGVGAAGAAMAAAGEASHVADEAEAAAGGSASAAAFAIDTALGEAGVANRASLPVVSQTLSADSAVLSAGEAGGALLVDSSSASLSSGASVVSAAASGSSVAGPVATISAESVEVAPPSPPASIEEAAVLRSASEAEREGAVVSASEAAEASATAGAADASASLSDQAEAEAAVSGDDQDGDV